MPHSSARFRRFLLLAALLGALSSPSLAADPADLILHSGRIVTVDEQFSIASAMAIRGERIQAVGDDESVLKHRGPDTEVIDLHGGMVLPGLIDSHVHATGAAMFEFDHEVPSFESVDDVLRYLRARAEVVPEGEWIVLRQAFITRFREPRYPTRGELDEAAPKHPVAFRTGPDAVVNTLALQKSGIDRAFAAAHPEQIPVDRRTGEPTGQIRRAADVLRSDSSSGEKQATRTEKDERLLLLLRDYNRVGLTAALDRNCNPEGQEQYERLHDSGRLPVRMRLSRALKTDQSIDGIVADVEKIAADPLFKEGDARLRIIGVKAFLDGGMLTGSAYMNEPWGVSRIYGIEDPAYRGMRYILPDVLAKTVEACVERGLAFTAHSVGDGAVQGLLDAYEEVNSRRPVSPSRSTITHSNFMSADSVRRCAELGIGVDIQPAWLYLDTATLVAQFGVERLTYFQPLRSLFDAGVKVGGGSDHMQKIGSLRSVNPYDPWLAIWTAVTRRSRWYEGPLHPEQALTREQAIRFYTINNAWLLRAEEEIGSLEAGKRADFIRIDRDLLACPVDEIRDVKVLATYVDGVKVSPLNDSAAQSTATSTSR